MLINKKIIKRLRHLVLPASIIISLLLIFFAYSIVAEKPLVDRVYAQQIPDGCAYFSDAGGDGSSCTDDGYCCLPSGNAGGGGNGCTPSTSDIGCPAGYSGAYTSTTNADCSTTVDYTCTPPVCNNSTTDQGCQYGGHDYVTRDCNGSFVSESNTCQGAPVCNNTTTNNGCPAGYSGSDMVTRDCNGNVISENDTCTPPAPPVCNNTTTNEGCGTGYTGTDYVTRDCHGTYISDTNSCTPVSCQSPTTTNIGCPAGYSGTHTQTTTYSNPPTCSASTVDNNNCSMVACPSPSTTNLGCPTGYNGSHTQTTTYAWPSCSPSTADNNSCSPGSSSISVSDNLAAGWSISPGGQSGTGTGSVSVTSGSGTLYTISPNAVAGYDYPPTVTNSVTGIGSSMMLFGGQNGSFTLSYVVNFDYSLSNNGPRNIMKGGRDLFTQETITETYNQGITKPVDLSVSGLPANVDASVSSSCSPNCSATVTFTVHPSAAAGTYTITVTGSPLGKTTSFPLTITNSPDIIVSCTAAPTSGKIGDPITWTAAISGGVPPYTYTWVGSGIPVSPAPTMNPYTLSYSTTGSKTASLHVTDSLSNVGTCGGGGSGGSGGSGGTSSTVLINFNPQFQEF